MRSYEKPLDPGNGCSLPADEREGLLDAYASGELDPEEQQQLATHVAHCLQCQQTLVELREYHRLLRGVYSASSPLENGQKILSMGQPPDPTPLSPLARQRPRRGLLARPIVRVLLVAAALLFIVANVVFVRFFLQATQRPLASPTASATPADVVGDKWQTLLTLSPAPTLPANNLYPAYPLGIPAIASSPVAPSTLYLCRLHLARTTSLPPVAHLLYRSDDLGAHWQELPLPAPAANCEIRPDPAQANSVVLEDNQNGAFLSRDRGQHWQRIPPPPGVKSSEAWKLQATPVAGRVYVSGYWTSNLHTWTRWYPLSLSSQESGNPSPSQGPIDLRFVADPRHPDTIYTDMSPTCPGTRLPAGFPLAGDVLCRSDDDGQSWRLLAGIPIAPGSFDPSYCLVPAKPDMLYVQGIQLGDVSKGGLMRSTDGGASWQIMNVFQDPRVRTSLRCSASNDPYPSSYNSQDPFFTYDLSKSHFTLVDDTQSSDWTVAITDNGTLYHASATPEQDGQATVPAGIAVLSGTRWTQIAPLPPAYAEGLSRHPAPDVYRMMIQVLPSTAGPPVILAYDDQHLYRYPGT